MKSAEIYAISMLSFALSLIILHFGPIFFSQIKFIYNTYVRQQISYPLITKRHRGSSNVSILHSFIIFLFIAANTISLWSGGTSKSRLNQTSKALFSINLVPLFLGGRTSFLVDRVFRLQLDHYELLHRWVGRVCLIEGLVHAFLSIWSGGWDVPARSIAILSITALCLISTVLFLRRRFYELFLKSHFSLSLALLCLLWFHAPTSFRPIDLESLCLLIATCLWSFQYSLWFILLLYRNHTGSIISEIKIIKGPADESVYGVRLKIELTKTWNFKPGQYIYISVPRHARRLFGLLQSHPYLVAWADGKFITLMIERQLGFSCDLEIYQKSLEGASIWIDGPYGTSETLTSFDKVTFVASGVGIAASLTYIRDLLRKSINRSARVRRISLHWFLQTIDEENWASDMLKVIEASSGESRRILSFHLYLPEADPRLHGDQRQGGSCRNCGSLAEEPTVLYFAHQNFHDLDLVKKECEIDAGTTAITVCGSASLEKQVRAAVSLKSQQIYLFTSPFQPVVKDSGTYKKSSDNLA